MKPRSEWHSFGRSGLSEKVRPFVRSESHFGEEMVQKIRAAVKAREDENFTIVARTDARTNLGLEEARRGRMYEDAGADVIFIESPESEEEMQRIAAAFDKPTLANMLEGGRTPIPTVKRLQEMGFAITIYCVGPLYAAAKAVRDYMIELREKGTPIGKINDMITFEEVYQFIGLHEYRQLEKELRG